MRLAWTIWLLLAVISPGSASATVTVDHVLVGSRTEFFPGEAFQIQVRASWDGQGSLVGIFSSTGVIAGDPAAVVAESAVFQADLYRGSLFTFFVDAGDATLLARFGQNQLRQLGDPTSVVRSVQYGMPFGDSLDPRGAASGILITTITYRVMSLGGDTITIGSLRALGDTGPLGDVAGNGSTARVVIDSIPEPRSALLLAMGLAGLRITRSRRQSV